MTDREDISLPPGDLPPGVRLFPLEGVILLPRSDLPLHIFEPRYRAMVTDSLASDQMIAMIQPRDPASFEIPELYQVGTLGRITRHQETGDGRFLITLRGVARFRLARELPAVTPYRQAEVHYLMADLQHEGALVADVRSRLEFALQHFAEVRQLRVDMDAIMALEDERLVSALSTVSPLRPAERQALLEAADLNARADLLIMLMQLAGSGPAGRTLQ